MDPEEEMQEEEQVTVALAHEKVSKAIGAALAAVNREDWEAAEKALDEADKAVEGYAYGYPEPSDLKKALGAALAACKKKDAEGAKKALGQALAAAGKKEERKGQAQEEEARGSLAGEIQQVDGEYLVTLITPGAGNGYDWPAEVLARDHAVFDRLTSFTNHERRDVMAARPGGRTIDDICGVVHGPTWSDGAVKAQWRASGPKGPWVAAMIDQIIRDRLAGLAVPDVGMSVDVSFAHKDGRVTRLMRGHSADIVFNAARGPRHGEAFARVANAVQESGGGEVTTGMQQQIVEGVTPEQVRVMLATMAEAVVDARLDASGLPTVAKDRVRVQFAGVTVVDVAALDASIEVERKYLAGLVEDTTVKGMGAQQAEQAQPKRIRLGGAVIGVGRDPMETLQLAVDRWFGLSVADPAGVPKIDITQLYADLTGDVNVRGLWDIEEARERTGLANITDTTFNNVVADAINKVALDAWQMMATEGYEWWKKVVHEQDFESLHEVDWITYGGFGDLPELAAGQEYPELTISDLDTTEDTDNWVKPGGLISVPIETFDKGAKTGAFKSLPKAMGVAAIRNLSAKVAAIFTSASGVGPTLADGVALFNAASHLNLATTALSFSAWAAVIQDQYKQTEQNSAKRMAIRPWGILVPIELEVTALQVLTNAAEHATADRNINPYQFARERVVTVPDWTDTNNWATFTEPKVFPSIGVGYRFGRQPQIIAEPGGVSSYGRFTQDVLRWKVFWMYVVSVVNYRGLQKRNVA